MVFVSGGSWGADCDVDKLEVVDSGIEVWCCGGARSGCVVGWGWVNKEDNGLGLGDRWSHWMDSTAGRLAGFLEGDSFYLLAGGGNSKAG